MAKQFYCKWSFDMPLHGRRFCAQTGGFLYTCREQAAYSLNLAVHRKVRIEAAERNATDVDIVLGRVFEGFDSEFSYEAAYFWYLRSQANLVCETAIDRTDVVVEALEDISQRISELYPNVALSVIDHAVSMGLKGEPGVGLRIEGDITVYSAFYITQLLLRCAFYSTSFSDYKSNGWRDHSYKLTFDFLAKYRDILVECSAHQLSHGVGPSHMASLSLPSHCGAKGPRKGAQALIDNLMAALK